VSRDTLFGKVRKIIQEKSVIHVIAVLTAKPGKREEVLRHFRANVPAVRAEKGCIEYSAAVDAYTALPIQTKYGPDTFVVIEKWESTLALEVHAQSAHMQAYAAKIKGLLASRTIYILSPVPGSAPLSLK
jgi:quinol monooxygenase YgiN